jgi:hypothetical protein
MWFERDPRPLNIFNRSLKRTEAAQPGRTGQASMLVRLDPLAAGFDRPWPCRGAGAEWKSLCRRFAGT